MKTTKLFFMAALALMTAACSNDDNEFAQQPQKAEGIPFTATITVDNGAKTRALAEDGTTIVATWADGEEVALIYDAGGTPTKTEATVTKQLDGSATISATLAAEATDDSNVTIIYPASAADGTTGNVLADLLFAQDGTLTGTSGTSIAEKYDVRKGTGKLSISGGKATVNNGTAGTPVSLTNQFAIFKFTVKNAAGDANIGAKLLIITIGSQDYDIIPGSPTSELYVALPAISGQEVSFFATSGTGSNIQNYTCSKASVSFDAGKYYQSILKMPTVVPTNIPFTNDNRTNYFESNGTTDYFRCELYNPWSPVSHAIDPADIVMKKYRKVNVTFTLTGFTFTNTAKMVLCCNRGSEQSWESGCFIYSRAISVNSNGTYTVSWTNDTGSTVNWNDGSSALTMTMQYDGYASLTDTSADGLKAACEIQSITID